MTAQPLQISWNNFTGGINDQKYQGQPGRYYTGYNVDTRRFDVRPSVINQVENTYEANINCIFNEQILGEGDNNIVWLNNGKIYYNTTLKHTLTTGEDGYRIGYMKVGGVMKLYYFYQAIPSGGTKYIHRSGTDGDGFNEGYFPGTKATYTSTDGDDNYSADMQVISEGFRILFSHYNNVFEMDDNETITKLIGFQSQDNVVGITQFQGEYKIYTSNNTNSKIHTWDGVSTSADVSVIIEGIQITSVINDGAYDYFTSNGSIYKVAGVQYQEIYHNIGATLVGKTKGFIRVQYKVLGTDNYGLGTLGSLPGYKDGINTDYAIDFTDGTKTIDYGCFDYSNNNIYYSSGTKLFSDDTGNSTTVTSYIESLVFVGTNIQYEKSIDRIFLKFSGMTADCLIKLECQINESGTWVSIWQGKNSDISGTNHGLKINKNIFLNTLGNFNTIRFKVSFISNGLVQGKFYGVDLFGNEDIGK